MEECVNKEHNDNNYIETYTSINTTYEGKETCLDDEEGEESTDTENSNGEKFIERISIEKGIIPTTNVIMSFVVYTTFLYLFNIGVGNDSFFY